MESTSNDYLHVEFNEAAKLLYLKWHRNVDSAEYRAGVRQLLGIIDHEVNYLIVDSTRLRSLTIPEQQWLFREVCPVLANSQLKKMARIGNGDLFNDVVIDNLAEQAICAYNVELTFRQCKTYEEALWWIQPLKQRDSA